MRSFDIKPSNSNQLFLFKVAILFLLIAVFKSCDIRDISVTSSGHQTLILISLDGFAANYLNTAEAPYLDSLIRSGATGALIPVFPSKTFPNHYTQATGLYPQNHGIVSNRMYDQFFDEFFTIGSFSETTRDGKWYDGEPIWVTAGKQGLQAATMFWPGSEAKIKNARPDIYFPFNGSISAPERVDQVLAWLSLDAGRPNLITLYFEHIDQVGHQNGPNKKAVREQITQIDDVLGQLMQGIRQLGLADQINIVIVSDHGMSQLSRDRVIFLDDYLSLDQVEIINWTPLLELIPLKLENQQVFDQLKNAHPHLRVYQKKDTPEHWHFKHHHRIPPILGLADPGWSISSREYFNNHPRSYTGGAHGYEPKSHSMHGIFIASGPAFRTGSKFGGIEAVHLYELMCKLLAIKPAENDGDVAVWQQLLND